MHPRSKAALLKILALALLALAALAFVWLAHLLAGGKDLLALSGFELINRLEVIVVSLCLSCVAYLKALHFMDVVARKDGELIDHTHGKEANEMIVSTIVVIFTSMLVIAITVVLERILR